MSTQDLSNILCLPAYVQENPPREPFLPHGPAITIYAHAFERIVLQRERTSDMGYGLWRDELLGQAGISGSEQDSLAFAKGLCDALAPQLSIRMLRDLCIAFAAELAEQENARAEFKRIREAAEPGTPP
jgi:hypothetical protein